MQDFEITVTESPSPEQLAQIRSGLTGHARAFVKEPGFEPLAVLAKHSSGTLAGGATGKVNWDWLHIGLVWVDEASRRRGLGTLLLERIETEGRKMGCRRAHLSTFTYQARPFYERNGYAVFGTLEDYPPGYARVFLRKSL